MRKISGLFIFLVLTSGGVARADQTPDFGDHPGYTSDVDYERNSRSHEMVMLNPPAEKPPLAQVIFDEKLSKEFQQQYAYKFGVTQAEQVINAPARDEEYTYNSGRNVTLKDYQSDQRSFGEYMARRLTEYHFDNYAKKDRDLRQVVAVKERFSNLDVKVKSGWAVTWKFNISGPTMDVEVKNPYKIEMKSRVEMSTLRPNEIIYTLGYDLTPKWRISALVKQIDGIFQLVGTRKITSHLSTSLTGSIDTSPVGPTVQQNLLLVGLSWAE